MDLLITNLFFSPFFREMSVFFFEHMPMIESMVERLKTCVEQAYIHSETFVHFMMEGTENLKQVFLILFQIIIIKNFFFLGFCFNE